MNSNKMDTVSRRDWNASFMLIAKEIGRHSTCARWDVGAVLVRDRRILSTGFNGVPAGHKHCISVVKDEVRRGLVGARRDGAEIFGLKFAFRGDELPGLTMTGFETEMVSEGVPDELVEAITLRAIREGWINEWHAGWSEMHELHAEVNCLAWAAKEGIATDGSTMYVTLSPCVHCAKAMIAAGVREVWFGGDSRRDKPDDGVGLLERSGIRVRHMQHV